MHNGQWNQYIIGTSDESLEQIIEQYKDIPNRIIKIIKGCPVGTGEKLKNHFSYNKIIDISNDFEWIIVEDINAITDFVEQECVRYADGKNMNCKMSILGVVGCLSLIITLVMMVIVTIMAL